MNKNKVQSTYHISMTRPGSLGFTVSSFSVYSFNHREMLKSARSRVCVSLCISADSFLSKFEPVLAGASLYLSVGSILYVMSAWSVVSSSLKNQLTVYGRSRRVPEWQHYESKLGVSKLGQGRVSYIKDDCQPAAFGQGLDHVVMHFLIF